jgi:primase-polymerase (primpol)-like protein
LIQTTIDVLSTALFGTDIQIDLRKYDQWVLWRGAGRLNETTGEVAGLTRVPYTIHLHKASTTNPHTWASFE